MVKEVRFCVSYEKLREKLNITKMKIAKNAKTNKNLKTFEIHLMGPY